MNRITRPSKSRLPIIAKVFVLCLLILSACQINMRNPEIEWCASADAQIISYSDPIRFPGIQPTWQDERMDNHLPEGVLYGDGRFLWVEYKYENGNVTRRVKESRLTKDEMTGVLQRFVDAGFFRWKDEYVGWQQEDGPPATILDVHLTSVQKTVIVNGEPPEGFNELVAWFGNGAGMHSTDYAPQQVYLSAYPEFFENDLNVPSWPGSRFGFGLEEVSDQPRFIEGDALAFAWQLINDNPASPLVRDEGQIYLITLQVPDYSSVNPPPP